MISEINLAEFRRIEVEVVSAVGAIDLTLGNDEPTWKLIRQILGAVAEWEKCALVQKLRASRLRRGPVTRRRAGSFSLPVPGAFCQLVGLCRRESHNRGSDVLHANGVRAYQPRATALGKPSRNPNPPCKGGGSPRDLRPCRAQEPSTGRVSQGVTLGLEFGHFR